MDFRCDLGHSFCSDWAIFHMGSLHLRCLEKEAYSLCSHESASYGGPERKNATDGFRIHRRAPDSNQGKYVEWHWNFALRSARFRMVEKPLMGSMGCDEYWKYTYIRGHR